MFSFSDVISLKVKYNKNECYDTSILNIILLSTCNTPIFNIILN